MRKNLVAALVTFGLCGGAVAAIAAGTAMADAPRSGPLVSQMTPAAQAQDTPAPDAAIQLAQAGPPNPPPPPRRATPSGRGAPAGRPAAARPAATQAQRDAARAQTCQNSYARMAGSLASLEVRLNLTAAQGAAFTRWRDVRLAAAKRAASDCVARPAPQGRGGRGGRGAAGATGGAAPASPVERMTREETMLQQRLSNLQAERPALDALYTSLTPAQRQTFARQNRPMMGGMRGPGMRGPGMRGRGPMMRRGPGFGRGPGMRGPMRPMPPRGGPDAPPPPPPQ